jgi:hypothetical protein
MKRKRKARRPRATWTDVDLCAHGEGIAIELLADLRPRRIPKPPRKQRHKALTEKRGKVIRYPMAPERARAILAEYRETRCTVHREGEGETT